MTARRYVVVGTGAIGGLYGAKLAQAGHPVTFVGRSDVDVLATDGLHVTSVDGDLVLPVVRAVRNPAEAGIAEVVLVATKTTANAALLGTLGPLVAPGTVVVAMQNGFGVESEVAAALPGATVLGGMCFVCANRVAPGRISHLDYGRVTLGEHRADGTPAGETDAVRAVAEDFTNAGIEVSTRPDLLAARWQKLVWNLPFNGLSVVLDADTDAMMASDPVRALCAAIMDEVVAAADAHGHPVGDGFAERMLANTAAMTPYATSMKLDFDARRPLELDAIYDRPLAVAAELGVATPRLDALAAQLHFLDDRNRA